MSAYSSPSSLLSIRHVCFMFILQIKWIRSITDPAAISPDRLLSTNISASQNSQRRGQERSFVVPKSIPIIYIVIFFFYFFFYIDVNNIMHFAGQRWLNMVRHVWPTTAVLIQYRHLLVKLQITNTNVIVNRQTTDCFLLREMLDTYCPLWPRHVRNEGLHHQVELHEFMPCLAKALSFKCNNNLI